MRRYDTLNGLNGWKLGIYGTLLVALAFAALALTTEYARDAAANSPPGNVGDITLTRADGEVTASWDAVSGATKYHATYSDNGGSSWHAPVDDHTNITTASVTFSADNSKSYIVGVRAGNANGQWSGWRNSPQAGPHAPPGSPPSNPPGAVASVTLTRSDGEVTASWDAVSGATKYHATYTDDGKNWYAPIDDHRNIAATSVTFNADNSKTYKVGVRAGNSAGWSGWRDSPSAGPYAPPTATPTFTPTPIPTATPEPTATPTPEPTAAPTFTSTPTPTSTSTPEPTATPTNTPEPTATPTPEPTATPTNTPEPTATATPEPTATSTPIPTQTPTSPIPPQTPTPMPTPVETPRPTPSPPAAPAGLTASASDGRILLTWDDPADTSIWGYEYQINHNDTSTGNLSGWGPWQRIGTGWATVNHMIGGLTNGREYRFHLRALNFVGASAAAPNAAPWFASATPQEFDNRLVVSSVTGDSAIMNATGYPNKWWYARIGDPANSQCVEGSAPRVSLTGLTENTLYEYQTYFAPGCLSVAALDRIYFSTSDGGAGNLTPTLDGACGIGWTWNNFTNRSCAASFTTGDGAAAGYFLDAVTVRLGWKFGNVRDFSVALHAADANGNPASEALATLSGSPQNWNGAYTFSCEGGGDCDLAENSTYFIVLSAPGAAFNGYGEWKTRNSGDDYGWPPSGGSTGGWSIGDGGKQKTTYGAWADLASGQTPALHVAANETDADLRVSDIASTSATIHLNEFNGWHYRADQGPDVSCASSAERAAYLSGLTTATSYVYTAYSDSACETPVASIIFTTLGTTLTVSDVTETTAILTLAGHSGDWHFKADIAPEANCTMPISSSDMIVVGLTRATTYTYSAYSDANCTEANKLATAAAFTTGGVSVSNLGETAAADECLIGSRFGEIHKCAQGFTTGGASGGYVLRSVTAKTADRMGQPSDFSVQLYDESGGKPGAAVANSRFITTYNPTPPETAGVYIYNCYGTGCQIQPDTQYFIVMSATDAKPYSWTRTEATGETETPSSNGWSIANSSWVGDALDTEVANRSNAMKIAASVNPSVKVSVSNLAETADDYCAIGGINLASYSQKCATAFTTGGAAVGYKLNSATAKFRAKSGAPGIFSVSLRADANGSPGATVANATFSGSSPETAGEHTFACSGAGCILSANTTYHLVMSASANDGINQFRWDLTQADGETNTPSNGGWSIANSGERDYGPGWLSLAPRSGQMKIAATVNDSSQ